MPVATTIAASADEVFCEHTSEEQLPEESSEKPCNDSKENIEDNTDFIHPLTNVKNQEALFYHAHQELYLRYGTDVLLEILCPPPR